MNITILAHSGGRTYMIECERGRFVVNVLAKTAIQFSQSIQSLFAQGYWYGADFQNPDWPADIGLIKRVMEEGEVRYLDDVELIND